MSKTHKINHFFCYFIYLYFIWSTLFHWGSWLFRKHTNVINPATFWNFSVPRHIPCGCIPVKLELVKGVEFLANTLLIQHNATVLMTHHTMDIRACESRCQAHVGHNSWCEITATTKKWRMFSCWLTYDYGMCIGSTPTSLRSHNAAYYENKVLMDF